jgi:hypothetical protein
VALVLLLVGSAAVLSINVVETGYGVKGDEATYVSLALSAAYDGDLAFERRDLERFWSIYGSGPEGIFLKTGKHLQIAVGAQFPFISLRKYPDARNDRLYHGKAFAYSVAAAPLVRLFGLNGLLLFNVILLWTVFVLAYLFLVARMPEWPALGWASGFLAASIVPVYVAWLTSEIFNFALVFIAYFLWLYKEVAPPITSRWWGWVGAHQSDIAAAALLGIATYSKPPNLLLIAPLIALRWWRREWLRGAMVGVICAAVIGLAFGANAAVTGEFNYQGGERKSFYGKFPFQSPEASFANRGIAYATDSMSSHLVFDSRVAWGRFADNLVYALIGRYSGLVPYYFPGVLAVVLWLVRWKEAHVWQVLILLAACGSLLIMMVLLPFTWAGGGGAPGNRYFLSTYPVLLFMIPALHSMWPPLAAWGGSLFVAAAVLQPFVTSEYPWRHAEHGLFRLLPVEITMINDLPIMIDSRRGHVPYGRNPQLLLYFFDSNLWFEGDSIWTRGGACAQMVARTSEPISALQVTAHSPLLNSITVRAGGSTRRATIRPGESVLLSLPVEGSYSRGAHGYLWSICTERGFVPRLSDPASTDGRFLGVQMRLGVLR